MKSIKIMSCILAAGMLFTSCNMSNTGKGALIGEVAPLSAPD